MQKKSFLSSDTEVGRNKIQEQANRSRKVRFRGPDGKITPRPAGKVPSGLKPHPNQTPKFGHQQPLPEDRPSGLPPTP